VADGMAYLHASSTVHLDLKPENVLLTSSICADATCKIADLGLAQSLRDDSASVTNHLQGSVLYIAPELCDVSRPRVDALKVDVYAFGIMLGYMLSQQRPWLVGQLQMALAQGDEASSSDSVASTPASTYTATDGTPLHSSAILREASNGNRPAISSSLVPEVQRELIAAAVRQSPAERPTFPEMSSRLRGWLADAAAALRPAGCSCGHLLPSGVAAGAPPLGRSVNATSSTLEPDDSLVAPFWSEARTITLTDPHPAR
jgi:serine/threonine protein kinase